MCPGPDLERAVRASRSEGYGKFGCSARLSSRSCLRCSGSRSRSGCSRSSRPAGALVTIVAVALGIGGAAHGLDASAGLGVAGVAGGTVGARRAAGAAGAPCHNRSRRTGNRRCRRCDLDAGARCGLAGVLGGAVRALRAAAPATCCLTLETAAFGVGGAGRRLEAGPRS